MAERIGRRRQIAPDPSFAARFEELTRRLSEPQPLAQARARAFARFFELGIPTRRDEAWKFTDVTRAVNRPMRLAEPRPVAVELLAPYRLGGEQAHRLVFLNGRFAPELSDCARLEGRLTVTSLAELARTRPELLAHSLDALDDGRSFTALNAALVEDGAWIELAAGSQLAEPLQLLFITSGREEAVMAHPRCILRLGPACALTLIETHVGLGEAAALTNLVVQLSLAEGAFLAHDRLAFAGANQTLLAKLDGELHARSRYCQTTVVVGGALVRTEQELRIEGAEAECLLAGVALPRAHETVDNFVRVHHRAGGSHSDQHFKSIVADRGHHVFAGKIIVHPGAQKTNAYQKNDNLLLGDNAEVDTKPELEIYADDVKCSHGATCSDLDASALFYLRARGLDLETSRALLMHAFAREVIDRLRDESARALAERMVTARLGERAPLLRAEPLEEAS